MRAGSRKDKEQPFTCYVLSFNVAYVFTSEQCLKKVALADSMGGKTTKRNKQYVFQKFREIFLM